MEPHNIINVGKRIPKIVSNIGNNTWGVKCGLKDLDDALLGFHGGELIVLAGRPSSGKTSCSIGMALGTSKYVKTLYFSLEVSANVVQERMLCQEAEINYYDILKNGVGDNKSKLEEAAETISKRKLFIDDTPNLNTEDFEKIIEEEKVECAFVDYVQLISSGNWSENRVREIDVICRNLRAVAKQHNIPVILLAQLNRQVEQRPKHRPLLCDLKDSGSLEQLAQVVLLLHRPSLYESRDLGREVEDTLDAEIIIAKAYNGPTGVVRVGFMDYAMKFVSLSDF